MPRYEHRACQKSLTPELSRYGVHPNQVTQWKRQAKEGMSEVFLGKADRKEKDHESEVKELHARIGQLTVERDFLAKAFGR